MSLELRNSLWNILDAYIWTERNIRMDSPRSSGISNFCNTLWFDFFKKTTDTIPSSSSRKIKTIRDYFFEAEWYEIYNFLEFVAVFYNRYNGLHKKINHILGRELSGYRLIDCIITDITDQQEIELLEDALNDGQFQGATGHLKRALELFSDRETPDYRNSIKESISAVESICKVITDKPNATLPEALKILKTNNKLHPALKDGFIKLYGYTSNEDGIRHAMLDEPDITYADAYYFLISCTSFTNYLKTHI